jgi:hypothetical protein
VGPSRRIGYFSSVPWTCSDPAWAREAAAIRKRCGGLPPEAEAILAQGDDWRYDVTRINELRRQDYPYRLFQPAINQFARFNRVVFRPSLPELQRARQNPNARLKTMNLLGQCYRELGMLDLATAAKIAGARSIAKSGCSARKASAWCWPTRTRPPS